MTGAPDIGDTATDGAEIDGAGNNGARIVFTPSGISGAVTRGTTVLDAARRLGVDLDSVCGGRGICGRCQIRAATGAFAKWAISAGPDALGPRPDIERFSRPARPVADDLRLGCMARVLGDCVIDVPPESQVHRQVVRKELVLGELDLDPRAHLYYLEVASDGVESGERALATLLREQHGLTVGAIHPSAVWDGGSCTIAAAADDTVVACWPGFVDAAYGIAIDLGSTTVAGHLCDLATGELLASGGRMNPQIRFGEDLMSRVSYVMMNPGGDAELTNAIRDALDDLVGELVAAAAITRDRIIDLVLVGNPIMHHLALGFDVVPLGQAPFTLHTADAVVGRATDLDLDLVNAEFYFAPCIAGHVGADTAAAMLAVGPHRAEAMQLLVDVGTNAEILLGNCERQYAASSPTGPAFEGAQISCGQRATAGAIERVRIDHDTLEARVKVIGCDLWSDEPGFADAVGATGVTGVCGSGIIEAIAEMYLAGVLDANGVIVAPAGNSGRSEARESGRVIADGRTLAYVLDDRGGQRLTITQSDVRAIQLAKAALRAGIDLLVERAGSPRIDRIHLAGAFGAHIDSQHALVLGLIPDLPLDRVRAVGNAAGEGAVHALLSMRRRAEMEHAVRNVTKIETATEPRFQELFVAAMAIPHAFAPTNHLSAAVALPAKPETPSRTARRRRAPHTERSSS